MRYSRTSASSPRRYGPAGEVEGCFMLATNRHDITVHNGYTVSFSGVHHGTVTFHTHGTTARFAISTCPHWGILFEGPVTITNHTTGRARVCKFLFMDLYIQEFRFLGHDDRDALLEGSGVRRSDLHERFLGEPSVVSPQHLLTLLTDDHLNMFFQRTGGEVKRFCMENEPKVTGPDDPIVKEARHLREKNEFQPRDCPVHRVSAPALFPHYAAEETINCKRFALVAGQVFGLRLPDEVQFFAYANMNLHPRRNGYERAIERYILQCSQYSEEESTASRTASGLASGAAVGAALALPLGPIGIVVGGVAGGALGTVGGLVTGVVAAFGTQHRRGYST